jgi:hypothetical protein
MISASARYKAAFLGLAVLLPVSPALAGIVTPAPGPMIGAGVPALAVFGAGYWLIRRRRRR